MCIKVHPFTGFVYMHMLVYVYACVCVFIGFKCIYVRRQFRFVYRKFKRNCYFFPIVMIVTITTMRLRNVTDWLSVWLAH